MTPGTFKLFFTTNKFSSSFNSPKATSLRDVFKNLQIFEKESDVKVFTSLISFVFSYHNSVPLIDEKDAVFDENEISELLKIDFIKDSSLIIGSKRRNDGAFEITSQLKGNIFPPLVVNEDAYPFISFDKFVRHSIKHSGLKQATADFSIENYDIQNDSNLPPFDECVKNKNWMNILKYSALYIRVSQYRKSKDFSCLHKGLPLSFLLYSLKEKYPARFPAKSGHVPMMIDAVNAASEIPGALKIHGDPDNVPPEVMEVISRHMTAVNMRDQMIQEDQKVKIRGKKII